MRNGNGRKKRREPWLAPCEVADFLGVHVKTVYRYIRKDELPHRRLPGGHIRVDPEVLDDFGDGEHSGASGSI